MDLSADLSPETLGGTLHGRPFRTYPALLSAEADAMAWARAGAPDGAVVVADYQASPRGRAGLEWRVTPGGSLCFSAILRPELRPEREGWLYTVATSAVADVLGERAAIEWPDQILLDGERAGAAGIQSRLGPDRVEWAVMSILVEEVQPPRGPLLGRLLHAVERRAEAPAEAVVADYLPRCITLGRSVRARLIPLGPTGTDISGVAVGSTTDGSLVLEGNDGRRVHVTPQSLGLLEDDLAADGE
jgi:BirA family transcriptional regulator, biotin operon repressor / biotin---[acetyl-CoA-carboxylase] ligase